MSARVELEEIESTRSEKALAIILVVFLLIGTLWFYVKVPSWVTGQSPSDWDYTPAEQALIDEQNNAWKLYEVANRDLEVAKADADLALNNLNVAIGKGEPTDELQAIYDEAQAKYEDARAAEDEANQRTRAADEAVQKMEEKRQEQFGEPSAGKQWAIAGIRFGFVIAWLSAGFWMLARLRSKQSRFLALAFSVIGAGVVTAFVFAVDYITDWIDWQDLGPLVLSIFGVVVTVISFISLQRYLAKRIPARRVRKGDCPFCGYPVRGGPGEDNCEGCGREVIAACSNCGKPRRVGSTHCAHCGQQ